MIKLGLFLSVLLVIICDVKSQTIIPIDLQFGKNSLKLNQDIALNDSVQIQFSTVRFYLMNVVIYSNSKAYKMKEAAKLIDAETDNFLIFEETIASIDSVSFLLGTDYAANTSGVLEGDLDPINGMYWAWNSGYINVKLEGKRVTNGNNKTFEFHLGGYVAPHATARNIRSVNIEKSNRQITIDFQSFFLLESTFEKSTILIPGVEAAELMDQLATSLNE